jgi:hypothetical protein
MTDQRPSRRNFAVLIAGVAAWPGSAVAGSSKSPQSMLLSLFEHSQSACAIGALCLNSLPPGQTARALTEAIVAAAALDAQSLKSRPAIKQRIAEQVARDFSEGAVVNVDGWMLSLTETRLCALAALSMDGTV